jgi:hypothetical protein
MSAPDRPEGGLDGGFAGNLLHRCRGFLRIRAFWRARKPRPEAVHCWHAGLVAWPTPAGWHVERAFDSTLKRLRAADRL